MQRVVPWLGAMGTLILLGGLFLFVFSNIDLSSFGYKNLFALATLFVCALFSVGVFQALRIKEDAQNIATSLAHDMLSSSRDLFLEVYKSSPVPYIVIEHNGTIISANFAAVGMLGVPEEVLKGRDIFSYITGDDEQHIALFKEKTQQGLGVHNEDVRVLRGEGGECFALLSLLSFKDERSGERRGLLTLVDVTKQKEIDRAKSEFVSLASHQLRTPIAATKWNVELLLLKYGTQLSSDMKEYVEKVRLGVSRMEALVDDFLNMSRFELGTLTAEHTTIQCKDFILSIIDEHKGALEQKHIQFAWNNTYEGVLVSDTHLLRMIVGNLLSNAIKYTPEQGTVTLTTSHTQQSCTIVVSDTGMGIPHEDQEKIFSKMFRASNATREVPDGTGLGLYVVKEAVGILRGTISFVSEEGKGTTFTVTLPTH